MSFFPSFKNLCKRTFFTTVVILISGCAAQVNMLPALSPETVLQANEGVITARIINTSVYPLPFNQLTISPENLNESKTVKPERLLALKSEYHSSTVFGSPVKAGNYALSSIRAFHTRGDMWYSRFVASDAKFGTFTVTPGEVTDLGTIIYYQKPQNDKYSENLLRLANDNPGDVIEKYFPFYLSNKEAVLSWDIDGLEDERHSQYVSVAQNPTTYDFRYLAPDGAVYFIGKLGIIIKRNNTGEWEIDAVDTNLDLSSIAQNHRGDVIVGGIEGKLFWKQANRDWIDISLNHDQHIEKVKFVNENTIDLLVREKTELKIFRAITADYRDLYWNKVNGYNSLEGWDSDPVETNDKSRKKKRIIVDAALSELDDKNQITIITKSASLESYFGGTDRKTFIYNPESWEIDEQETTPEITSMLSAGAIEIGFVEAGFWSWDGKPDYLRYNKNSQDWEKITTYIYKCLNDKIYDQGRCIDSTVAPKKAFFNFLSIPVFSSELDAVAVVSFGATTFGKKKGANNRKIITTNNGGRSWSLTSNELPKEYCTTFVPEIYDRLLVVCDGSTGEFYESYDSGSSWTLVREREDF